MARHPLHARHDRAPARVAAVWRQIGGAVVNPGDIVFADTDGVFFVPPKGAHELGHALITREAREPGLMRTSLLLVDGHFVCLGEYGRLQLLKVSPEKYDVVDMSRQAGGGEYPNQDGFGWTNGVVLELLAGMRQPVGK